MSADWTTYAIDDVIQKRNQGVNTTTEKVTYSNQGTIVIRANNIKSGYIEFTDCAFVDDETFYRIKEPCKPKKGDVLYTNIGSQFGCAAVVEVEYDFAIAWNVLRLQPSEKIDSHFLAYQLNNPVNKKYIQSLNSSSTMPFVSGGEIGKIELNFPSIDLQKEISKKLRDFDKKIHLNTQTNQTLESIAQAIFKSWFVDFEPVKAKMATLAEGGTREQAELAAMGAISGKSEAELAQLQQQNPEHYQQLAETSALFPSAMVESELGEIPEGWASFEMSELVKQIKPGTNYQPKRQESGIPFVNGKHVQNGFLDFSSEPTNITVEEYERVHKSWKPEKNDVLITRIGTLGRVGIVTEYDLPMALHYNSICIKEGKIKHPFIFFLLRSDFFQYYYHLYKKQAVQEFVTIDAVEGIKIILPINKNDLDALTNIFDSFIQLMKKNHFETINLKSIRDSLLPKLLSGEIDLSDIQSEVA